MPDSIANQTDKDKKVDVPAPKPEEKPTESKADPKLEAEGNNLDELGYEKVVTEPDASKEKPVADKSQAKSDEKVKDPATGYDKEPEKVEEAPPVKEDPPVADDYDKALDGLPKEQVAQIKDFAKKNNITVDQAKALGELRKSEIASAVDRYKNAEKEAEKERLRIRAGWHKELKEDKTFGGENFDKNVSAAEKVLNDFMPGLKKSLTERGAMLPPYVMRDLAKMADHLYATEKLVTGDPAGPKENEKEVDDPLSFYQ